MEEFLQKITNNSFADFKGFHADASIPVPAYVVNEIIAVGLKGSKSIESCQVSLHEQNHVAVDLKTTLFPWHLNLKLKLDHSVDLESYSSPKVRAWLENNRLLGSLGSLFKALPEGIKLFGNQAVLDLWAFLRTPEERKVFELIKSLTIRTEEGKVIFDVKLRVDE
jgi:hypothetical protein